MLRPSTVPSGKVRGFRLAPKASADERTSRIPSRFEDRTHHGDTTFPDLDRVFLHGMLDGAHLLDLEIPDELPSGAIQSKHDDPIDEEPFVPENLALGIRAPLHDHARRQFVVAEHLEEIEHSF